MLTIITIIVFLLTLGLLVITHEMGHFLAAKKFGIKVLEFGFGLPPKIFSKKKGETEYSLNWLPIGGFVRLLGEDETSGELLNNPRSFAAQKVWKRIVVVIAGVLMNLVLAWIMFYSVIILQGYRIIYPANGLGVNIVAIEANSPAANSGIKVGEKVISINNQQVKNIEEAISKIKASPEKTLELNLEDELGGKRTIQVTPNNIAGEGKIGIAFSPISMRVYLTPKERIFSGISYSWDLIKLTFGGFGKLFSDIKTNNLAGASQAVSGPVGIAVMTGGIVSLGVNAFLPYLWFVGILSLTLAVMNILPFPALDGGRLIFLISEALFGKKVRPEVEKWVHTIGMAILLGLIVLITLSDIKKLF